MSRPDATFVLAQTVDRLRASAQDLAGIDFADVDATGLGTTCLDLLAQVNAVQATLAVALARFDSAGV